MQAKAPKTSTKTHRRSRTGCFTCRLRRKKCDEGKPMCKACKHLGLACEYKRPSWWGNVEQRKRQKEAIKQLIKKTKLSEKVASITPMSANTSSHILPPQLSHSVPTSDECYSDAFERARSHSVDSGYSLEYEYDHPADYNKLPEMIGHPTTHAHYVQTFNFNQPYEAYDVLTEKCNYINTLPSSRRESEDSYCSTEYRRDSTYSSAIVPSMPQDLYPVEAAHNPAPIHHAPVVVPSQTQPGVEEVSDYTFFDFSEFPQTAALPCVTEGDEERDQRLLNHFIQHVIQLILPVLDYNLSEARQQFIIPALSTNQAFLHSCLGASAMHIKATQEIQGTEVVDEDIMRHRKSNVEELCEAMNSNSDQYKLLESILGVILFQCCAGSPNEDLPEIPWFHHFTPALKLIDGMNLTTQLDELSTASQPASFHMTVAAWIDILGATMLGQMPAYADTYREKFINQTGSGLAQLMGCDDKVMYLISEIACLEAHKIAGLPDDVLLEQVTQLARQIEHTEPASDPVVDAESASQLDSAMLSNLMSAAFRCAARIYLTSLVPGLKEGVKAPFDHTAPQVKDLLDKLASILELIPAGQCGFDRSLVWVWLIGGSVATPRSAFRTLFQQRVENLGVDSYFGSFGCMVELINNVWHQQDSTGEYVHWRDVMNANGYQFLLI